MFQICDFKILIQLNLMLKNSDIVSLKQIVDEKSSNASTISHSNSLYLFDFKSLVINIHSGRNKYLYFSLIALRGRETILIGQLVLILLKDQVRIYN